MNKSTLLFIMTIAPSLLGSTTSQAQTLQNWQTVDLYQPSPGVDANATDIGTGADGVSLYAVGASDFTTVPNGNYYATIRRSLDSGLTWLTVGDYSEPGWSGAWYRGVGAGGPDTLFAAGQLWEGLPNTGTKTWIVRQSDDGGTTWGDPVDVFYQGPSAKPACADIKVNPYNGDVYAVGVGDSGGMFSWAVRKRAAGAPDFNTVDYIGAAPVNEATAVGFHATGGVFVVGYLMNGTSSRWSVRRSLNGGASWVTVDSFSDAAGTNSKAIGIAVSPAGAIYVCGKAVQLVKLKGKTSWAYVNNWVVRRSIDSGTTWTTVDRFGAEPSSSGGANSTAVGITIAPSGNVFISGETQAPSRHVVRKGTTAATGTMTWVTSDDFQLVPGQETMSRGITCDSAGNIFSAGRGVKYTTGPSHFLVRKLAGPQ